MVSKLKYEGIISIGSVLVITRGGAKIGQSTQSPELGVKIFGAVIGWYSVNYM